MAKSKNIEQVVDIKIIGFETIEEASKAYDDYADALLKAGKAAQSYTKAEYLSTIELKKKKRAQESIDKGEKTRQSNIQMNIDLLKSLNNKQNINNDQNERMIKLMEKQNKVQDDGNKKGKTSISIWARIANAFKKVIGFGIGLYKMMKDLTKVVQDTVVAYDALEYSMKTILQSSSKLVAEMGYLMDITSDYGGTLINTSKSYLKFKQAATSANLIAQDTQQIFRSVSKAGSVMGLSNDALTGTMLALEQMLSKGKLSAEELRRQLGERLPGAYNIMARSMGVTSAQLDDLLRKGNVLSKDVLPAFARQLEQEYNIGAVDQVDKLGVTIDIASQAWTNFAIAIFDSKRKIYQVLDWMYEKIADIGEKMEETFETDLQKSERLITKNVGVRIAAYDKAHLKELEIYDKQKKLDIKKVNESTKSEKEKLKEIFRINEEYAQVDRDLWNLNAAQEILNKENQVKIVEKLRKSIAINEGVYSTEALEKQKKANQDEIDANEIKADKMLAQLRLLETLKEKYSKTSSAGNISNREREKKYLEYTKKVNKQLKEGQSVRTKGVALLGEQEAISEAITNKGKLNVGELEKAVGAQKKKLAYEEGELGYLEHITEEKEAGAKIDEKAAGSGGRVKTYFMEKHLTGEIEKQIALAKIQLGFQKHLQTANFTTIKEKEDAYNKEFQLLKKLKGIEVEREIAKRQNDTIKETERLTKALRKHTLASDKGKNATFTYINAVGKEVEISTSTVSDYVTKLKEDEAEWILKKTAENNDAIFEADLRMQKDIFAMRITESNRYYAERLTERTTAYQNELAAMESIKGSDASSWYRHNKKKYDIEQKFRDESLKDAIEQAKTLLAIAEEDSPLQDYADAEIELTIARGAGTDEEIARLEKELVKKKILVDKYNEAVRSGNKAVADAALALMTDNTRKQKEQFDLTIQGLQLMTDAVAEINNVLQALSDRKMEKLTEDHALELEMHDEKVSAAKGDADQLEALAVQKEIDDKRREKEKRKMEIEAAKRNKAAAIFSIGMNTAIAIMNAATVPYPFTVGAIVAASILGASQLAVAISKPIPKLKEGRDGGEATLAIVGDGGRPEVIERTDGSLQVTPGKDTLTYLNEGDKVYRSVRAFNTTNLNNADDQDYAKIEEAIMKGFSKAKIINKNVVNTNPSMMEDLWMLQQSQF